MCSEPVAGRAYSSIHPGEVGEAEAVFAGIVPLRLSNRSSCRRSDGQRIGHLVFNLRGRLSLFAEMHQNVNRLAILSLAVQHDLEMHRVTVMPEHTAVLWAQAGDTFLPYLPNVCQRAAYKATVVRNPPRKVLLVEVGLVVRNLGRIDLFLIEEICYWLHQPSMRSPCHVDSLSRHSEVAMRLRQNR